MIISLPWPSMVIFARASAWREASTGPGPMISGDSADRPVGFQAPGRR
jgi:hypothetical protein